MSEKALKLKTEDLTSKTEELNELNKALARANQQLELKNIIVKADKDRIAQVISNLLNNAVKFTKDEPDGTISISYQRKKED